MKCRSCDVLLTRHFLANGSITASSRSVSLDKMSLSSTGLVGPLTPGPWFNIKMPSYQYRKSHCGDKTVVRSSYLHNGISYTGKMASLHRTTHQDLWWYALFPLSLLEGLLHMTVIAPWLFCAYYQWSLWHHPAIQYMENQLLDVASLIWRWHERNPLLFAGWCCGQSYPLLCGSWCCGQDCPHRLWWRLVSIAGEGLLHSLPHTTNIVCSQLMQITVYLYQPENDRPSMCRV